MVQSRSDFVIRASFVIRATTFDIPIPMIDPSKSAPVPRILGVDPGLNITGYAVIEPREKRLHVCEAGVVRSTQRRSLAYRVREIHDGLAEVIASLKPAAMALEELYSHYDRPRTSILMGHARGVICLAAAEADIEVTSYNATQVKLILTGNGRAPKSQMQQAIRRELALVKMPEPADIADALAIALCHHYLAAKAKALA